MKENLVSIKKIFNIIDSCTNLKQLKTCETVIDLYVKLLTFNGIINPMLLRESLMIHMKEKREELKIVYRFKGKVKRKPIKIKEYEEELIKYF